MEKVCSTCQATKPIEAFARWGSRIAANCKECNQTKKQRDHTYYVENRDKRRSQDMFWRYGITLDQYNELLAKQGGHCAICPAVDPGGRGRFHVDHDHETGRIRGLLCNGCNVGLGYFKDNPERLRSAADYLVQSCT